MDNKEFIIRQLMILLSLFLYFILFFYSYYKIKLVNRGDKRKIRYFCKLKQLQSK
jgi:hypothetical protein